MAITNRNLPAGTRLVAKYKGQTFYATILESGVELAPSEGRALGPLFKSLSAAGAAIMGGIACNGWRFWTVDGDEPEAGSSSSPSAEAPKQAPTTPKARTLKLFKRLPGPGLEPDQRRYWCHACAKSFITTETEPQACPEGHRQDDPALTTTD